MAIVYANCLNSFVGYHDYDEWPISTKIMTATLTYTLILAAVYFGIKAIEHLEQEK